MIVHLAPRKPRRHLLRMRLTVCDDTGGATLAVRCEGGRVGAYEREQDWLYGQDRQPVLPGLETFAPGSYLDQLANQYLRAPRRDYEDDEGDDDYGDLIRYPRSPLPIERPKRLLRCAADGCGADPEEIGVDSVRDQMRLYRRGWRRNPDTAKDFCPTHAPRELL